MEIGLIFLIALAILIVPILSFCSASEEKNKQEEKLRNVINSAPISAKDFLNQWTVGARGSKLGYKSLDRPGCYVILTNPITENTGAESYEAVYIGQSINVCSRIRQHLTGHGNGNVYADVRSGKDVQIRILPCDKTEMNKMEKELISLFKATDSYNRTKGGAKRRAS